jgi:hypothetical protein
MALDPKYFRQWEPLPDKGTFVRCYYKDGTVLDGQITLVWLAMDELAFKVRTMDGEIVNFLPGLEDGWGIYTELTRRRIH